MLKRYWEWMFLCEGMISVTGYSLIMPQAREIFVKMKKLGGVWDNRKNAWEVPEENVTKALALSPQLKAPNATEKLTPAPVKPTEAKPKQPTSPAKPKEMGKVPVTGFSFIMPDAQHIFVQMKKLGASWDGKVWQVPEDQLAQALSLSPKLKATEEAAPPKKEEKPAAKEEPKEAEPIEVEGEPETVPPEARPEPPVLTTREGEDELRVSGDGIKFLKQTWEMMGGRGAPVEINDFGFGKGHYDFYRTLSGHPDYHGDELPLKIIKRMMDVLGYYRKTQLADRWDHLTSMVKEDIKKAQESKGQTVPDHGDNRVYVYNAEPRQFNRVKVYIPGLDLSKTRKLNKLMDEYFKSKNMPMEPDNYGANNYNKKRWQHFQKDKTHLDTYWVHPNVLNGILELLKTEGYEIAWQDDRELHDVPGRPKIRVVGQEQTRYGPKLIVTYQMDMEENVKLREELIEAKLWPQGIVYMGRDEKGMDRYGISLQPVETLSRVIPVLRKYLDTTALDEELQKLRGGKPADQSIAAVGAEETRLGLVDRGGNKMSIKVPYSKDEKRRTIIKQVITYNFPESSFNWGNKTWDVEGDYQQYSLFKKLLERYGWDTADLERIIASKVRAGGLKQEMVEGDAEEGFEESIEAALPESDFDLNPLQKEGVSFLYHRKSAVLGDETGFGKTVQLVSAAEMKMKATGYKGGTLIIVPKQGGTAVKQWEETVIRVIGEKNKNQVSTNPLQPRRWTILWYEMFSIPENLKDQEKQKRMTAKANALLGALKGANFMIVIMDELHKVKKASAAKTRNIVQVTDSIPIHWGASATISSNWPIDVRNQLVMVGHHLGRISEGKFNREFAGMVPKGYNGAYVPGDIEDQIRAAENLNKWLHLTGMYVRRSKDDVRDMPGLAIKEQDTPFDRNDYERRMVIHVNRLKDPELVISILNAAREELAVSKVPATVEKVSDLVQQGKKVVVFTAFLEAGRLLKEQLSKTIKEINPTYELLTYTSDTHKQDRAKAKERFTNDPKYRVILMSIKMGGTGIDFPNAAQNMVINDYDWTPEQAEQSEGRIYRINTEKPVTIEYMIAPGTIDEALFDKVQQKRFLASKIQQYRKDYQEDREPEMALEQIIKFRKELEELNAEIKRLRIEAARMFNPKVHESVDSI